MAIRDGVSVEPGRSGGAEDPTGENYAELLKQARPQADSPAGAPHVYEQAMSLLAIKYYIPQPVPDAIDRTRITNLLNNGLDGKRLTLVVAPAGTGKTLAVAAWVRQLAVEEPQRIVAWYSLDDTDNEPATFLRYFVGAIRHKRRDLLADFETLLTRNAPVAPAQLTPELVHELSLIPQPIIVVLNDFHVITNPAVLEIMRFMLRYLPLRMNLVLISRKVPQLSVAQARGRGEVVEVGAADLTFTPNEAFQFLRKTVDDDITPEIAKLLQVKTEGWAVGLRLASVSLRNALVRDQMVREFEEHSHRFILDYLLTEVLTSLTEAEMQFLLKTSIIDRFDCDLSAAIIEEDPSTCQKMIEKFEDDGLPIIALDHHRRWYRCHTQFQAMLLNRLRLAMSPESLATLHRRAAKWLEQSGELVPSVRHYLAGGDAAAAVRVIESKLDDLYQTDRWDIVSQLNSIVPRQILDQQPRLLLAGIWLDLFRYDVKDIPQRFRQIQSLLDAGGNRFETSTLEVMQAELLALQSMHLESRSVPIDTRRQFASRALEMLPRDNLRVRSLLWVSLVITAGATGTVRETEDALHNELATTSPNSIYYLYVLYALCLLKFRYASLKQTLALSSELLGRARQQRVSTVESLALAGMGLCHFDRDELESSIDYLTELIDRPAVGSIEAVVSAAAPLIIALHETGHGRQVDHALHRLSLLVPEGPFNRELAGFRALYDLLDGRLVQAVAWADHLDLRMPSHHIESWPLVYAMVRLAQSSQDGIVTAQHLLEQYVTNCAEQGENRYRGQALVTCARLCWALGDRKKALDYLEEAITLSFALGYRRRFIHAGPEMIQMLASLVDRRRVVPEASSLLQALLSRSIAPAATTPRSIASLTNSDPSLSQREMEVLNLLATDMSNLAISEYLSISPRTVRNHTANIYRKLRVSSRQDAVLRGLALGLLEQ